MQIHNLKRKNKRTKHRQVGRGGKRGKTSGRGTKGQKARSGRKLRPEIRDMIKKLPKLRGRGVNANKPVGNPTVAINLDILESAFNQGDKVTPTALAGKKIIKRINGRVPLVKILGTGSISKALVFKKCSVSASVKDKIIAAGGLFN
ncbi:MAG: uL15 family ribosomal protein [Patescibacteria group bacterium]